MSRATTSRPRLVTRIMARRPPGIRSMTGPISGVTTANGAMVRARYRAMRLRAASGLIEKKIDPARATAITASVAVAAAWTRARRWNGLYAGTGRPGSP